MRFVKSVSGFIRYFKSYYPVLLALLKKTLDCHHRWIIHGIESIPVHPYAVSLTLRSNTTKSYGVVVVESFWFVD